MLNKKEIKHIWDNRRSDITTIKIGGQSLTSSCKGEYENVDPNNEECVNHVSNFKKVCSVVFMYENNVVEILMFISLTLVLVFYLFVVHFLNSVWVKSIIGVFLALIVRMYLRRHKISLDGEDLSTTPPRKCFLLPECYLLLLLTVK